MAIQYAAKPGNGRGIGIRGLCAVLGAAITLANSAGAGERPFDWRLPNGLEIEIGTELNTSFEGNTDLDKDQQKDIGVTEAEVSIALTHEVTDIFTYEFEAVLNREFFFVDEEGEESPELKLDIETLIVKFSDVPVEDLMLELGRRKFRDEPRRFLFDEVLDVVSVVYAPKPYSFGVFYGREKLVDKDILNFDRNPRVNYLSAFADHAVTEDAKAGVYFFVRDDREGQGGKLYYLGGRSSGRIGKNWIYWIDISHLQGDEEGTDVKGAAFDSMLTYVFDAPLAPSITLGYAWGSGDQDPDDNVDGAYRQTGLQKNESMFAGVGRFKYFGEVFDPELRNIRIFTAGVGIRPYEDFSLGAVFHNYRLDEFAEELGDARIEADLNTDTPRKDLGNEINLVAGIDNLAGVTDLNLEFAAGYFWPGDAFLPDADEAFVFRLDIELAF